MILSKSSRIATVFIAGIFSIFNADSQQSTQYLGKLLYVSVDEASYSIDSITVYYNKDRILWINQPGEETKAIPYRRIADLTNRKQYWIIDSKKLILEDKLNDEAAKRKLEELPGTPMVQNTPTRAFISELQFPAPANAGLEQYTQKISVAGMKDPSILPEDLYLVDYGFYKGRIIVKKDSDAYFVENKDRSRKSTFTLMRKEENVDGPSSVLPVGYTKKTFSLHEFFSSFERPAVDDLIRFYLEGSLKN